jgi:LmbE family N-acetylglucosaminyl deacetylase
MVLENAQEGCVRETFGAVMAGWQARTAEDPRVREELGRIAGDELRHAELAWAVDDWAAKQLTSEARQRVREARREAFAELERLLAEQEPDVVLVRQAGLPSRDAALQLLGGLQVLVA